MTPEHYAHHLSQRGVNPTAMRLLVYHALATSHHPLSLRELCDKMPTAERSTIFRSLTTLLAHHLVHAIEDGTATTKYEACEGSNDCTLDDQHPHFYCTSCHRTICFHNIHIPPIHMPQGFRQDSVNYLVKGICPDCQ